MSPSRCSFSIFRKLRMQVLEKWLALARAAVVVALTEGR